MQWRARKPCGSTPIRMYRSKGNQSTVEVFGVSPSLARYVVEVPFAWARVLAYHRNRRLYGRSERVRKLLAGNHRQAWER